MKQDRQTHRDRKWTGLRKREKNRGMTADRVSFANDNHNTLNIIVLVAAQIHEYTKNNEVYF